MKVIEINGKQVRPLGTQGLLVFAPDEYFSEELEEGNPDVGKFFLGSQETDVGEASLLSESDAGGRGLAEGMFAPIREEGGRRVTDYGDVDKLLLWAATKVDEGVEVLETAVVGWLFPNQDVIEVVQLIN